MNIQCPHCGYARDMAEERIPDGELTVRCPACGKTFLFSKAAEELREESAARPDDGAQAEAAAPPGEGREDPGPGSSGPEDRSEDRSEERGFSAKRSGSRRSRRDPATVNPWEEAESPADWVSAFWRTCLRASLSPGRFFSGTVPRSVLRALGFLVTVCVLQTLIEHVWSQVFFTWIMPVTDEMDPQLRQFAEMLTSKGDLVVWLGLRCVMLTAQICIFSAVLHLGWRVLVRRSSFSVVLQVVCYAQAPLLLSIVPGVGSIVGLVWSLCCVVIGCRAALRFSWGQTLLGMAPLMALLFFSYMHFLSSLQG